MHPYRVISASFDRVEVKPDVRSAVALAAPVAGLPEADMLAVALIESKGNPSARNGQFGGLFQMGIVEWQVYGKGDRFNARDNALGAANLMRASYSQYAAFCRRAGVTPLRYDALTAYMCHQQGGYGAYQILHGGDVPNPQMLKKMRRQMLSNDVGTTSQFVERWKIIMDAARSRALIGASTAV